MRRPWLIIALLCVCGCGMPIAPIAQRQERAAQEYPSEVEVNLLAMGDWGSGSKRQRVVAETLADYVRQTDRPFDAMLLTGDNFYVRLDGVKDSKWRTLFEDMYDPVRLNFPFYATLGNHDYEDGKDLLEQDYSRRNPESRWKMPARWYRVDFLGDDPLVTVLVLDSNRTLLGERRWAEQMNWLREELAKPRRAQWLVCCAHHPLYSNGDHGDNGVLQRTWGPLFEQYGVDLYICGHDHDLQHLQLPQKWTTFLLVGGGGQETRPMRIDKRGPFSRSSYGFAHLRFLPDHLTIHFVNSRGEIIHAARRDLDGKISIIDTTGTDIAQPRTVKSITRPDAVTQPADQSAND